MIEFHKASEGMGLVSTEPDEESFVLAFSEGLSKMIEEGAYPGDWQYQLDYWLPCFINIVCAYRGYKSGVETKTVYMAGYFRPSNKVAAIDDRRHLHIEEGNSNIWRKNDLGKGAA